MVVEPDVRDVRLVGLRVGTAACLLLAAASGFAHAQRLGKLSRPLLESSAPSVHGVFPRLSALSDLEWGTFRASAERLASGASGWLQRYRLAGTFVVLGAPSPAEGGERLRKAILDDREQGAQILVGEGETLGPVRVERVWADRVVLNADGETIELRLSYREGGAAAPATPEETEGAEETPALEISRFGRRVGESRWELSRSALMDYYRELLDEPERIARMYETFEPVYEAEGRIGGYRLAIKGEEEFLGHVGLREGDVVRAVNSLHMTSQSRAEFFLREFAQGRLDAVVMEIERDGAPQKLVYLIQ